MAGNPMLVGMGNPLLDISAEVGQDVFDKYEVLPGNAILAEEKHLPIYKELSDNYKCDFIAGGATMNAIRVCQWMSQTPNTTGFMGCISNDEFGQKLQESVKNDGVEARFQIDENTPTGTCAVLVLNKERSLIANISAANNFTIDHLRANWSVIENAKFYYIASFFLTVTPESIVEVGKHAAANGKTFAMNISAPFLIEFFKDPMMQAFPYTDIVFGNETEALKFSEVHGFGTEDFQQIALRMAELPKETERPRTVVITRGQDSTVVACNGQVTFYDTTPLAPEQLVDTNGAGDAFVGGFLSELVKGSEVARCVAAGHYAAREIIQQSGCVFPPTPNFS